MPHTRRAFVGTVRDHALALRFPQGHRHAHKRGVSKCFPNNDNNLQASNRNNNPTTENNNIGFRLTRPLRISPRLTGSRFESPAADEGQAHRAEEQGAGGGDGGDLEVVDAERARTAAR